MTSWVLNHTKRAIIKKSEAIGFFYINENVNVSRIREEPLK
jgi:hypothetical protein